MDVDATLATTSEPASSALLTAWLESVRDRLDADQNTTMEHWFNNAPFEAGVQQALRAGRLDSAYLTALGERLERRKLGGGDRFAERAARIASAFEHAATRPVITSTFVWRTLGTEPKLASSLIQSIRERARLPGLRKTITPKEIAGGELAWFEDRQIEDAARWAEHIPARRASTLAETIARVEHQRSEAGARIVDLVPFLRRVASFLLALSSTSLDPLGFKLSPEAQLVGDPPLSKRFEVAVWASSVGRTLALRGQMVILSIMVVAPWSLALEVIASDLGRGISGAFGIVMRLRGEAPAPSAMRDAPILLCLPGERAEQLGARFERWSQRAYPYAVDAWRGAV